jgi:hypothetical protein
MSSVGTRFHNLPAAAIFFERFLVSDNFHPFEGMERLLALPYGRASPNT